MTFKDGLEKTVVADVCSAISSGFSSLNILSKTWERALSSVKTLPNVLKSNNVRVMSSLRSSRRGNDLPSTVVNLLSNIEENFTTINLYMLNNFPAKYDDSRGTIRQKVSLGYLSLAYHIYYYLPEYIIHQLLLVRAIEKGDAFVWPERKQRELDEGIYSFAVAIDLLGIDPAVFVKEFNKYPEVVGGARADSILSANGLNNPMLRMADGFRGSPFFTIGSWVNVKMVGYIKLLEDKKRVALLYLDDIKGAQRGQTNPAQVKEIELLEEEIDGIDYELRGLNWKI